MQPEGIDEEYNVIYQLTKSIEDGKLKPNYVIVSKKYYYEMKREQLGLFKYIVFRIKNIFSINREDKQ